MKTFNELFTEALDPQNYNVKGSKTASLFLGRMQPIHNGHDAIIKMMKNPVVALVKGAKSSADKARNPFDERYQTKLIKALNPSVDVVIAKTGYIPDIINDLRKKGIEVTEVLAGDDRIGGYEKQVAGFNRQMPTEKQITVKFTKTPRVTSATTVRNAIKSDDIEAFKKNVPSKLWKEWDKMRGILGEQLELDEILNQAQRLKRGRVMKRYAKIIARKKKIKMNRFADAKTLQKRAQKAAINAVRKKVAGERGHDYNKLGASAKAAIDARVHKQSALLKRLTKKLTPETRRKETARLKAHRAAKHENYMPEASDTPNLDSTRSKIQADKDNRAVRYDRMRDRARIKDALVKNRKTRPHIKSRIAIRGEEVEDGTDELLNKYRKDTPNGSE